MTYLENIENRTSFDITEVKDNYKKANGEMPSPSVIEGGIMENVRLRPILIDQAKLLTEMSACLKHIHCLGHLVKGGSTEAWIERILSRYDDHSKNL